MSGSCTTPHVPPDEWALELAAWSCVISGSLGIVGNGLTLLSLPRMKHLRRQPITLLIVNLAVTDFLYCLLSVPSHELYINMPADWWEGAWQKVFCFISVFWRHINASVDFTTVGVIAIER